MLLYTLLFIAVPSEGNVTVRGSLMMITALGQISSEKETIGKKLPYFQFLFAPKQKQQ